MAIESPHASNDISTMDYCDPDNFAVSDASINLLKLALEHCCAHETSPPSGSRLSVPKARAIRAADVGRKLAVFDLDNTLIYTTINKPAAVPDEDLLKLQAVGVSSFVFCQSRPGAINLLKLMQNHFDVALFTASHMATAQDKVEWLEDRVGEAFSIKLYRDSCVMLPAMCVKDLRLFESRSPGGGGGSARATRSSSHPPRTLADIFLVEDCVFAGGYTPDNVVPIKHWIGDMADDALPALGRFLVERVLPAEDVRPVLASAFGLRARTMALVGCGCNALDPLTIDGCLSSPPPLPLPLQPAAEPAAATLQRRPAPGCPPGCSCRFLTEHVCLERHLGVRRRSPPKPPAAGGPPAAPSASTTTPKAAALTQEPPAPPTQATAPSSAAKRKGSAVPSDSAKATKKALPLAVE